MTDSYFWNKKIIVSYCLSILVFWLHCSTFANYDNSSIVVQFFSFLFKNTINTIAVPLFFILSGMAFYRNYSDDKYVSKITSRLKSLVVPYVLWNLINMLFEIVASTFFSRFFIGREKFVLSLENVLFGIFHYKYNLPFWFVFALIFFTVAAPIIDKLLFSRATSLLSIAALIILNHYNIGLPQPLFFTKDCITFYLIGGYIGRFHFDFLAQPLSKKYQILSIIVIFFTIIYKMLMNYGIAPKINTPNEINLAILGICFWQMMDLFLHRPVSTIPEFLKHSFWVFALHINVSAVFTKLLFLVLPKDPYVSLINFGITTLATLFFIEVACHLIKKYTPSIYMLLSGSR